MKAEEPIHPYQKLIRVSNGRAHRSTRALLASTLLATAFCNLSKASAATTYVPFDGEKTVWHDNFDRYDYLMDETTFAITPFKRPDSEKFAVGNPPKGQRRCIVVVPKRPAAGQPWSWQACYW